jgi:hypothetical protein
MWTLENRPPYDRSTLRYPSDLTDEEWALIGPMIPPAKKGGNKRTVDVRAVVNGYGLQPQPLLHPGEDGAQRSAGAFTWRYASR